ncbi:DUF1501 domain-containing protein [Stieleria sp. TO1_6]|uniref:DUF1501 domain-containing protein n=1 Tax=Stieleria tagensis TaxID=2956795 RepID=UPI00209BABBD|nr:DUF1501 domain-containing protein [Stieleria tagensis]MCO8122949.1 DUF1501 domain-containing protein [Stieleria tagensis]
MSTEPSRRDILRFSAQGIGAIALGELLVRDGVAQAGSVAPQATDPWPHHPAIAKRVIHIVLCGGLSQVDSFDYKPELEKRHGKSLSSDKKPDVFFGKVGLLRKSDWKFQQRGESGLWVSDLFPHLGRVADELTVIRSMVAETANHTPATFQQGTGFRLNGFPTVGSWLSFGMGCETDELPAYVVIPDARGVPAGGSINWSNGFLPARHQGVTVQSSGTPIQDIFPSQELNPQTEQASRDLLTRMNRRHLQQRGANDLLSARISSYELSRRMQRVVPEVTELAAETAATHTLYGTDAEPTASFGRSCLLARRMLERGVRYVQLFSGGAFGSPRINWDGHENMIQNHGREAARIDQPIAALLTDLRQRGMLDDTLVLFTSEFGRTPFTQSAADVVGPGRDHNEKGFSVWMAGAGLRPGMAYGQTDEIGWQSVENPVEWYDFHATLLHLLGMDHTRLTYYHNGIQRRLTNVHGKLIDGILA